MSLAVRDTPACIEGIATTPTLLMVGKPEPGAVRFSGLYVAALCVHPPSRCAQAEKSLLPRAVGRPPSDWISETAKPPRLSGVRLGLLLKRRRIGRERSSQ